MSTFAEETQKMREHANALSGESVWWSALASFRDMYETGGCFNTIPLKGYPSPNRAGGLMMPRGMTAEDVGKFREFVNMMIDLYPPADEATLPNAEVQSPQEEKNG